MKDLIENQYRLQEQAKRLLEITPLLGYLKQLGEPIQTGSSVTGLMVYPDIDFSVQAENPNVKKAIDMVPEIFRELSASKVLVADFASDESEAASYFIGIDLSFEGVSWHIDATVTKPGPIVTNPTELASWIKDMSGDDRATILSLKKELIDTKRYAGSRSQPPYTFRSSHLYEGVLKGKAKSVEDLELYFKRQQS